MAVATRASGGLAKITQDDFSAGFWRSTARHLIDPRGAYDLTNLLLDNDGSLYKRGGSIYKSTSALGTGLRWIWDGYLAGGQRTVFASAAKFGVLDVDDSTVIDLGGTGLGAPTRAVVLGGMLFIGGGVVYAGSRKTADYSTGTVAVTNGSKTVTGTTTVWSTNADTGMLLRVAGAGPYLAVASVDSNTQVTLQDPYPGTTLSGQTYALTRFGTAAQVSSSYAVVADRLVALQGNKILFSNGRLKATGQTQPFTFSATDYHELPQGAQGVGAEAVRDLLLVFATNGLWVVRKMAYDLTDANGNVQQSLQKITSDIVLWSQEGIAAWDNALIVPCVDGVWRIDGVSSPERLSLSITPLITGYVRSGYRTGIGAVYRNHYLLPIIDNSNVLVDLLVCRLDRPLETRIGRVWPWTRLAGHAAQSAGFVGRVGASTRQSALLSAGTTSASRVTDVSGLFEPSASNKNDADNTTPQWTVVTRDYQTGQSTNTNQVRRLKARYELVDAATDDPMIQAYYSTGAIQQSGATWGTSFWGTGTWTDSSAGEFVLLSTSAPEDDSRGVYPWQVEKRTRFIRFRLQSSNPAARMLLRSIQILIRPSVREK